MRDLVIPAWLPPDGFNQYMAQVCRDSEPWRMRVDAHHIARPGLEWGDADYRIPTGCSFYGTGTIELDPNIPDDLLKVQAPLHILPTARGWARGKAGAEAWYSVPRDQHVEGLRFVLNHSRLVPQAKRLGVPLRIAAGVLQGHNARWENVRAVDCGAWGAEAFPFVISGAMDGYDRHALYSVAPNRQFDEAPGDQSYIRNVNIDGYEPGASNAQVSHGMIVGALCNSRLADPWAEVGEWRQILRRNPFIEGMHGVALGDNLCQLATIYQCTSGEIRLCSTKGYHAGAYGDYYSSHNLTVHACDFEAKRPVAFLLSPVDPKTSPAEQMLPLQFSHDRIRVVKNWLRCLSVDEGWHAGVLAMKLETGGTRHIRNLTVDDNDIVMADDVLNSKAEPVRFKAGRENYAVQAQGVDGLTVTGTNRIVGFPNPWKIWPDCTNVTLPTPPGRKGCL